MANSADPDLKKPTDLDLHYLQRQGISGFSGQGARCTKKCDVDSSLVPGKRNKRRMCL